MSETENKTDSFKVVLDKTIDGLRVVLKATTDRDKLFVDCVRIENTPTLPSFDDLLKAIAEITPSQLIQTEILKDIFENLQRGKNAEHRRIAKAEPPKPGINGKLVLLVKAYGKRSENEAYDPRFIRMFDNIVPETTVARLYPSKTGTDGLDVLGKAFPAPKATDYKLKLNGKLEMFSLTGATFQTVIAKDYGYIEESPGQLTLKDELVIASDVDYRIGDLDFAGKINIRGNVMSGFTVTAKDDVIISGDVQGGGVESSQGSVIIKGSVLLGSGQGTSISNSSSSTLINNLISKKSKILQISAAKNIQVSQIDGATVICGGYLEVSKGAFNASINTHASLLIPEGYLVGGTTRAVCGVDAKIIGSPGHAKTIILLTSNVENSPEYEDMEAKIHAFEETEKLIGLYLGPLSGTNSSKLSKENLARFKQMEAKLAAVQKNKNELLSKREEFLKNAKYNAVLRINFRKTMHEGTIIKAGLDEFEADKDYTGPGTVEYLRNEKRFIVTEMKPLECEYDDGNNEKNKKGKK